MKKQLSSMAVALLMMGAYGCNNQCTGDVCSDSGSKPHCSGADCGSTDKPCNGTDCDTDEECTGDDCDTDQECTGDDCDTDKECIGDDCDTDEECTGDDCDTDEECTGDDCNSDLMPADYSDTQIIWRGVVGNVSVSGDADNIRSYTLNTTANLRWIGDDRNNIPPKSKTIIEGVGQMRLRSGHTYLDALWALAMSEAKEDSVSSLSNWAFANGAPMSCNCFDTGENWNYVWTRDTAYSMDLGMAFMDPVRAMNSLLFKVSDLKSGGSPQIVQDTGSGGSWPISTDRVIWSLGAYETAKFLEGNTRQEFIAKAFEVISNTLEADRQVVYDPKDGLYTGEQSYLDWRENTYQPWTNDDVVHIGMSKSFSTNTAHYIAMLVASEFGLKLSDLADTAAAKKKYLEEAQKYIEWAQDLRNNMRNVFYNKSTGLFSSMTGTYLDPGAHSNYDSLGQSLAILWDAADNKNQEQGKTAIANYPLVEAGPPVIWPQQPKTRIYHNRSIWPFVTAYHLRAALKVRNAKAVDNAFYSLVRGAAFNLSNMENFEFSTLQSWYVDNDKDYLGRDMSGPNINSRRQLWSVAGFMAGVLNGLFGMEAELDTIWFNPQITAKIRNQFLAGTDELVMENMNYQGKTINVTVKLPPLTRATDGFFKAKEIKLNGSVVTEKLKAADLSANNEIVITMSTKATGSSSVALKQCTEDAECYAPQMPSIPTDPYGIQLVNGKLQVSFTSPGTVAADQGTTYNIYRDGKLVAENVTSPWIDPNSGDNNKKSYCYSVTAVNKYGNESHHAKPLCYWGPNYTRADDFSFYAGSASFNIDVNGFDHYHNHFADWGRPDDVLVLNNVVPSSSGDYLLRLLYGNGRDLTGGITCGVKKVKVIDAQNNTVAEDVLIMPHLGYDNWDRWEESSIMSVHLDTGKTYKVEISDVFNMSYFAHFNTFNNGAAQTGGGTSGNNRFNLQAVRFLQKSID